MAHPLGQIRSCARDLASRNQLTEHPDGPEIRLLVASPQPHPWTPYQTPCWREYAQKGGQHLTPCWSTPDVFVEHLDPLARVENLPPLTKPQICFREVGDSHAQDWCTCRLMWALHCRARMPFAPREVLQMLLAQWKHWSERTRMALASSSVHHLTKRTLLGLLGNHMGTSAHVHRGFDENLSVRSNQAQTRPRMWSPDRHPCLGSPDAVGVPGEMLLRLSCP